MNYLQGEKSSGPRIWRTSVSPSQPGQYFLCNPMNSIADFTASSRDGNSKIPKPPTISLASVNGPSIALISPPESRTRAPAAVGFSAPPPWNAPDLVASSLSLFIASRNSLGGCIEVSACLTNIINRMFHLLFGFTATTYTSNEKVQNRHAPGIIFWRQVVCRVPCGDRWLRWERNLPFRRTGAVQFRNPEFRAEPERAWPIPALLHGILPG